MGKAEKALELLERAAKLGLSVEFQSGVNVVKKTAPVAPETINSTMEELASLLPEVRAICQRRAVAAVGKTLVSRRIWSKEHGAGRLVDAAEDGALTISISEEMRRSHEDESRSSRRSITSDASSVLILDETQPNGTSFRNDEATPEQPKKGILERLRLG